MAKPFRMLPEGLHVSEAYFPFSINISVSAEGCSQLDAPCEGYMAKLRIWMWPWALQKHLQKFMKATLNKYLVQGNDLVSRKGCCHIFC